MEGIFNYKALFDRALQKIKAIRAPYAAKPETNDLKWDVVRQQALFDFGGRDFVRYSNVINESKKTSISCLCTIIVYLLKQYRYEIEQLPRKPEKPEDDKMSEPCFAIKDVKNGTLLFFKEIEEINFWKTRDLEPEYIAAYMRECGASSCKYVYLMFDYAYLQVIGHNNDESDPGRGYNLYSIKWFFETYFGKAEYDAFHRCLIEYNQAVKEYLGINVVRSLTHNAIINFKKVIENSLIKFDYELLMHRVIRYKNRDLQLEETEFRRILDQFANDKVFMILLGKHDFAESLLTAEWLYYSIKMAVNIDLTIVGMGYCKAVEQLLFELICLHKNENRCIDKTHKRKGIQVPLNDENIAREVIDTTIGAMARFYKDNMDMLRSCLNEQTKQYVCETIFKFMNLRNGYFHKHNIHCWEKVEEIRNLTFDLVFLLLGAHVLTEENKVELGMPSSNVFTDYYRLCEYVNYHSNELFYLVYGQEEESIVISVSDMDSKLVNDSYIQYSGVYFKELRKESRSFCLTEKHLPKEMYLGKLVFPQTELVQFDLVKVKKIFANGRFVGPSIIEEDSIDY